MRGWVGWERGTKATMVHTSIRCVASLAIGSSGALQRLQLLSSEAIPEESRAPVCPHPANRTLSPDSTVLYTFSLPARPWPSVSMLRVTSPGTPDTISVASLTPVDRCPSLAWQHRGVARGVRPWFRWISWLALPNRGQAEGRVCRVWGAYPPDPA